MKTVFTWSARRRVLDRVFYFIYHDVRRTIWN